MNGGTRITQSSRSEGELVAEWSAYATTLSQAWFHPSIEPKDWRQEALIATWDAVRAFDPQAGMSFKGWLAFVIRRHLTDVLKEATREKRRGNVEALRVVVLEGETVEAITLAEAPNADPYEQVETRDELRRLVATIQHLSALERHAIVGVINGTPYDQLGETKSVDNALQRARGKLRQAA